MVELWLYVYGNINASLVAGANSRTHTYAHVYTRAQRRNFSVICMLKKRTPFCLSLMVHTCREIQLNYSVYLLQEFNFNNIGEKFDSVRQRGKRNYTEYGERHFTILFPNGSWMGA